MNNCLSNLIVTIKNGLLKKNFYILQLKSKISESILNILCNEGFILGYKIINKKLKLLKIFLKYKKNNPVIINFKLLSKPSQKIYYSIKQLWKIKSNNSLFILSTDKGLLSLSECKKLKIGGKLFLIIN